MNDPSGSRWGKRALRLYFVLFVAFLYAPIVILVIFSFNDNTVPAFPLSGFTLRWYKEFAENDALADALKTSAFVGLSSSAVAVALGTMAALGLARSQFRGKSLTSAVLLAPLVIPYVVLGVALLVFFRVIGLTLSVGTVVIGHVVIIVPYAILVLLPRIQQIDVRLEEAARDLGAGALRTFRSVTLPLIAPAIVSAFLVGTTISFDEYAIASFVIGETTTFPVYLFSQLRLPNRLPQVIAVAVVVLVASLILMVLAEVGRRVAERRLGELEPAPEERA